MIYERIVNRCKAQGISVMQLEKSCKLGNGTVAGWKNGNPRVDLLIRVADFFGITLDELVKEEGE